MDLAQTLADLISGYGDQKKALDDATDAARRLALAGNPAALALYNQTKAVQASALQFQKIAETIRGTQSALDKAAIGAAAFAAAASPAAFSTMTDSFKLVAMEVGVHFVPAVLTAAKYAQEFARWLERLSPASQELMTSVASVAAAAYVASRALAFVGVTGMGPFVAALAAGAIALLAFNSELDKNAKRADQAKAKGEQGATREEYENSGFKRLVDNMKAAGKSPEEIGRAVAGEIADAKKDKEEARGKMGGAQGADAAGWAGKALGMFSGGSVTDETAKQYEGASTRLDVARKLKGEMLTGKGPAFAAGAGGGAGGPGGMADMLFHRQKEMQPRYSAVEDAQKQFQLQALKDPMEQEMLRLQRKGWEMAVQWMTNNGKLSAGGLA